MKNYTRNIALANWFLEKGVNERRPLTQMQLQKLLYFAHALSLASENKPLCLGEFEAWKYGPVLPDVYTHTKAWGGTPITSLIHVPGRSIYQLTIPMANDSEVLASTWRNYGRLPANKLANLSHEMGSPWAVVFDPGQPTNRIPDEMIAEFYRPRVVCRES